MNISYKWLQAVAPTLTEPPRQLAHRLAMLGATVDDLEELGAGLKDVVVARVEEVRPHPDADRLSLCTVESGSGALAQVVCGAANVQAGGYYPFAPIGAQLPGGVEIRKAKLRGQFSEGMLCSARELGLGRDHAGLLALHGEWRPGTPLVEALELDDVRLVVDVTANRPDLLSHVGVARELAPGGGADIRLAPFANGRVDPLPVDRTGASGRTGGVDVFIDDAEGCPRYLGAVIRGVRVGPSPEWLAARLRAVGLRPINNVVDATNYVLFELGQPLHAFDLGRLGSEVRIRRARAGEQLRTLDGVDRRLEPHMLVIADAQRPVALAGVMGGEDTEVGPGTTDLFLECALFEPRTVRKTARALGLSTDASYRFERGVDPDGQPSALRRLAELIVAIAGGEAEAAAIDLYPRPIEHREVSLRPERVTRLLGIELRAEQITALLKTIGFDVLDGGPPLRVLVPGSRPDVTREVDLIEEVARRHGYDAFPEELQPFRPSIVPEDPLVGAARRLRVWLGGRGFLEARTVGFAPAAERRIPLLNPLSAEESHLRDSLLPGLLRRVEHNWARGTRDIRLFEVGTVFLPAARPELLREEVRVAAVFTGARRPPHWSGEAGAWDVWDLKGLMDEFSAEFESGEVAPGSDRSLAALTVEGTRFELRHGELVLGVGGRVAPGTVDAPAWAEPLWVFEALVPLPAATSEYRRYSAVPEVPAVERDLALLTPYDVSSAEVGQTIRAAAGKLLEALHPFDLYEGEGLPPQTRSVAWRLRFRAPDRTLTDAEVDAAIGAVLRALEERQGVRRR